MILNKNPVSDIGFTLRGPIANEPSRRGVLRSILIRLVSCVRFSNAVSDGKQWWQY